MSVSRRCFLKFFGGATAGLVVSPLPWKLLDDVSIWTQNGTWVAETPRGPVSHRYTTCSLCPAGCGLRLRQVGGQTVSAWAVTGHPLSGGRICPAGLGIAQIPFHPARIRGAAGRGASATEPWRLLETNVATDRTARVLARLRANRTPERFAILDLRPGRSLSVMYDEFLAAAGGGRLLALPSARSQAAGVWNEMIDSGGAVAGIDLDRAGAVISFGAPVFDGMLGGNRPPHVVQVQTNGSIDSARADHWLPIRPGTEASLALALAHVFHHEMPDLFCRVPAGLENGFRESFGEILRRHTPEYSAQTTGIEPHVLRAVAWDLSRHGPVIAFGGGNPGRGPLGRPEELALWILNLTLGCDLGSGPLRLGPGPADILRETPRHHAESLLDIPDGSLDLLLVDGSLPESMVPRGLLRRKMRGRDSLVVGMSPFVAGPAADADLVIPTPAPGEWMDDIPPRALAPRSAYALSPATGKGPDWALHPADFLGALAEAAGLESRRRFTRSRHEEIISGRLDVIHRRGLGDIFDPESGKTRALSELGSPKDLKRVLSRGGCWIDGDDLSAAAAMTFRRDAVRPLVAGLEKAVAGRLTLGTTDSRTFPLVLMPEGPAAASGGGVLPPVVNKLYRESNLFRGPGVARINPATARELRLDGGQEAQLVTRHGRMDVTVEPDEGIRPGVVVMSPAPGPENLGDPADGRGDILKLCGALDGPVRRVERAALQAV